MILNDGTSIGMKDKKQTQQFIDLVKANPELEVFPIIYAEGIDYNENYSYIGQWNSSRIGEITLYDSNVFEDKEELECYICGKLCGDETDEEIQKEVDEALSPDKWKKCILIDVSVL